MPVLQFSLAMLSGLINGNQADNTPAGTDSASKKSGGDQFSSLLDVVGNIGDTGNQQGSSSKKDEVKDPAAVAVNAPAPFRDPLDKTIQKVINHKVDDKKSDDSPEPAARANDNKGNSDNSSPAKVADKPALRETKGADKLDKSAVKASDNVADENVTEDELKAKISDRVDNLTNLMNIIAQLLAGAVQPQTNLEVEATATDDGANLLIGGVAQGDASPLAVFADLKNVLAQLQQFLQAANAQGESQGSTQNTPLTEEQNAALTAINNALQSDLDALKNLFPNGLSADDKKSLLAQTAQLPQTQVSDDSQQPMFTPVTDVKDLLENDIKLIKDALQKFKDDRAAEPLKFEAVIPKTSIQPLITEAANNNTPVTPQANNRVETPLFSSNAVINTVAEQAAGQQTTQPQNNSTPLPAANAAQASAGTQSDSNSGGNFSNNSGQGGNSQPQFTVGGLTATSARTVGAGTQFSNLLNRADQVPVSEQVVFHIKSAIGSGNTKITIQLSPEDLGKLDITLDVDAKGKTGVTITADNKQALDLLQRDSSGLHKALADAGLKTDENSLSFNLRGGEKEGQGQNQYQAASQYQKSQPDEVLPDEINIASMAAVTRSYTVNLPDGLDIKI